MAKRASEDFSDLDLFEWLKRPSPERPQLSRLRVAALARLARVERRNAKRPGGALAFAMRRGASGEQETAGEAVRPFASRIAAAEKRRAEHVSAGWDWARSKASDWLTEFGEDALWMPEFWSFVADLSAVASHDPASGIRRQNEREPEPLRIPSSTVVAYRGVEAMVADDHRRELGRIFSLLKGSRQAGCPAGTHKASTERGQEQREKLLAEYEAILERESFRDPTGASARAHAILARRHKPRRVTLSAVRKALRKAREERRDAKPK